MHSATQWEKNRKARNERAVDLLSIANFWRGPNFVLARVEFSVIPGTTPALATNFFMRKAA